MTSIRRAERLTDIFGSWPSFHDAEVLRLVLERGAASADGPILTAELRAFEITNRVAPDGMLVLRHETRVILQFREVVDLELGGFNHQNALFALEIEDVAARQLERVKFLVRFESSFGVGASFGCREIEVIAAEPFLGERPAPAT